MIYMLFFIVALISAGAIFACGIHNDIFQLYRKDEQKKELEELKSTSFSKRNQTLILMVSFIVLFVLQISLYNNTAGINFVKLYVLLVLVICAGIIDLKKKIIPNRLIIIGFVFWVFICTYELVVASNLKAIIINELLGFLIGFCCLALVSIVSKGALGFGDVKLFGIIGLISGAFCTYSTLLVSLIISVIIAVIGLITKKLNRKDSIPFGPCIAIGYIVVLFLTSY